MSATRSSVQDRKAAPEAPPQKTPIRLRINVLVVVVLFHLGAIASLFLFDWIAFGTAFVILCVTGCLGVTVGFHRCLTHNGFKTYRPVRWLFGLFGGLAGQANVIDWVAIHRKHHQFSDKDGDPHSPRDGHAWAHCVWFLIRRSKEEMQQLREKYAPDLLKDKVLCFIGKLHVVWLGVLGVALLGGGYLIGGWFMAVQMVLWGICARLVFMWHSTWAVNSVCHLWGYRNYERADQDDSRNNPLVAAVTFGEGYHENHHTYPVLCNHGFHRWWEIDLSYVVIRLMWLSCLAWDIKDSWTVRRRAPAAA